MLNLTRRESLTAAGLTALSSPWFLRPGFAAAPTTAARIVKNGRLKQSVSRWCFGKIPMPEFCKAVKAMGLTAIDLLGENEWSIVRDHGLICSMVSGFGGSIPEGFNKKSNHDTLVKNLEAGIPKVAKAGYPNVITFFGNRVAGMSDSEAVDNCIAGLERIKKAAEQSKVMVCVELLNSKVDHKGYLGDHAELGLKVVKAVNSPYVKLLYDIYHMQIMDGDIVRTIRDNIKWLAHFHTGGVPGRHELDDTQELNWRTVAKGIVETGYAGYFAHEFVPVRDPLTSLREAVALCDV